MSNVTLGIGGRTFTISCADGEESHVEELGRQIDKKVASLGASAGQNEVRMLLYAAIVLADELNEARSTAAKLEKIVAQSAEQSSVATDDFANRLMQIADRIENIAGHLEG